MRIPKISGIVNNRKRIYQYGGKITAVCAFPFFLLLAVLVHAVEAQDIYIFAEDEMIIRSVRFQGNDSFSDGVLRNVIETEKSPSRFARWLNTRISDKIGRPPNYFDVYQAGEDISRLTNFYESNGFFDVSIDTSLALNFDRHYVRLTYDIDEGERWIIQDIEYSGFDALDSLLFEEIMDDPELEKDNPYRVDLVEREYQRILDILYNNGYAKAQIQNVNVRYARQEPEAFVSMSFDPGERFVFGEIGMSIEEGRGYGISSRIIDRMLVYETGEIYSLAKRTQSERNLNRLGIFESAKIDIRIPTADDTSRSIPSVVNVRPRSKHEITPEILVNDENNAFNIGLGVGYANRNFLGGARILTLRSRFRVQSIQELQLARVLNEQGWQDPSLLGAIDIGAEITQPYFITTRTSGRWGVSYILEKHPYIQYSLLRNRIGVNHQFASTTYGFLDWTLERISPRTLGDDIPAEEIDQQLPPPDRRFEEPQFNSIIAFTLQRDRTDDVFSPTKGYFHSGTIEEAGLLPIFFSYIGESLPYSQYVKATFTGRWYYPLDTRRNNILGLQLKSGFATLYSSSNDTPIPIHRRFFAGGSGSVRGWKSRQLGPQDERGAIGGKAIIEGNIETRLNILRHLGQFPVDFNKLWAVLFLDFGNVWERGSDIKPQEIALATGFGIRYDTLIGPIRFDFGFKLYDPNRPPHRQWLFDRPFFKDIAFHFGIGHAF